VVPVGCGTKRFLRPPRLDEGVVVSTRRLSGIVAHEAADMTVTVEAGTTLAELNEVLMRAGQHLPLDPPLPRTTTIGSVIATDGFGPLRLSQGKVRDLLIGVTVVLADGRIVKAGGRVVKNVAGYDLMKLFTGSHGTLAVIAEATFKLRPYPERIAELAVPASSLAEAVEIGGQIIAAGLAPFYLVALNGRPVREAAIGGSGEHGAAVVIGLCGSQAEIDDQRRGLAAIPTLAARTSPTARAAYASVRDAPAIAIAGRCLGAKLSVLPSRLSAVIRQIEDYATAHHLDCAAVVHIGNGTLFLRCSTPTVAFAAELVALTRRAGGWVELDVVPEDLATSIDPWPMLPPGIELMRGIKRSLDPQRRLNPGRFVGGI